MCGIFGFVGEGGKVRDLVDALKKLEYRGYDSAGVAFWDKDAVRLFKIKGKVSDLETALGDILDLDIKGGIAHTRWATHGEPNDVNAHPHFDCERKIFVVHNGIIENHKELRKELEKRGHRFVSDTDTEVLAHLIEENYYGNILEALRRILPLLRGSYAVVAMHSDEVGILAAARKGSPLVIGKNENFCVVASDITPILKYTKEVIFLDEGETVSVGGTVDFVGLKDSVEKRIFHISWSERDAEKGGYKHFMLKEIMEEPEVLKNAMAGRMKGSKVEFEELKGWEDFLSDVEKVKMIACGTSHHAGMLFKYFIEDLIQIEVETDVASEMRYRKTKVDDETLFIAISQSGETADTLETVRKIKEKGGRVKKKPVPIDLRILEQAFIIAILRLGGRCKLNELLNEVERRVAPKFIYFPWKLQGPRSLAGKSWRDRLVLESCLKFLTEKGLYQIQLSIEGDNVFVKPANIKVFKDFMELL